MFGDYEIHVNGILWNEFSSIRIYQSLELSVLRITCLWVFHFPFTGLLREAFKKNNDETYGKFHILGGTVAQGGHKRFSLSQNC